MPHFAPLNFFPISQESHEFVLKVPSGCLGHFSFLKVEPFEDVDEFQLFFLNFDLVDEPLFFLEVELNPHHYFGCLFCHGGDDLFKVVAEGVSWSQFRNVVDFSLLFAGNILVDLNDLLLIGSYFLPGFWLPLSQSLKVSFSFPKQCWVVVSVFGYPLIVLNYLLYGWYLFLSGMLLHRLHWERVLPVYLISNGFYFEPHLVIGFNFCFPLPELLSQLHLSLLYFTFEVVSFSF